MANSDELVALRLSTESFEGPDKAEAFHELYGRKILKVEIDALRDEPVKVDMMLRALPGLAIATATTSPLICCHTTMMIDNDDPVIVFNVSGSSTYWQNGHETDIGPGDAILTTNGLAGTAVGHTARRLINWRVSRTLIAPLVKNFDEAIGKPIDRTNPAFPFFLSYLGILNDAQTLANPGLQRAALTHMIDLGALILGARQDAAEVAERRGLPAGRLRCIKSHILAVAADPGLTIAAVAAKNGISKSYVRKLFEADGTSFTEFVLNHRLSTAYRMLTEPGSINRPISDIAHAAGFNDLSYFNRTFRRVYGSSPSDIRARI